MKKILTLLIGLFVLTAVIAQTKEDKEGVDRQKTLENYSLYKENYDNKNYEDAYPYWRYLFDNAPKFRMSTYTRGANIVKKLYKKTKDEKYWAELMEIYAQRVKYFGNSKKYPVGYVLGKQGCDIIAYKGKTDPDALKKGYDLLMKSIQLQDTKSEPYIIDKAMSTSIKLYKSGKLQSGDIINNFIKFDNLSDKELGTLTKQEDIDKLRDTKNNVQVYFIQSGVASCSDLVNIFTPRFEEVKNDADGIKSITRILDRFDCNDTELFSRAAVRLYELSPDADAAYSLGGMFLKKNDITQAKKYLDEAASQETDTYKKANIHMKLCKLNLAERRYGKAKQEALEALNYRSDWGAPHMYIAKCYAAGASNYSSDAFARGTVFWAAVDRLYKSKKDPEFESEARRLIGKYSAYFPSCEEMFFRGISKGSGRKVGGWISESTTARCRK